MTLIFLSYDVDCVTVKYWEAKTKHTKKEHKRKRSIISVTVVKSCIIVCNIFCDSQTFFVCLINVVLLSAKFEWTTPLKTWGESSLTITEVVENKDKTNSKKKMGKSLTKLLSNG